MKRQLVHILNGDCLRKSLSQEIIGQRITVREAFIEGPVQTSFDANFWELRVKHAISSYAINPETYEVMFQNELLKLDSIKRDAVTWLWFDHDLFCQVNLWWVAYKLVGRKYSGKAHLCLPSTNPEKIWQGFAAYDSAQLSILQTQATLLAPRELRCLSKCWTAFTIKDYHRLRMLLKEIIAFFPFAIEHVEGLESLEAFNAQEGPIYTWLQAHKEQDFLSLYPKFYKNFGYLGLGDSQVKRMLKNLDSQ